MEFSHRRTPLKTSVMVAIAFAAANSANAQHHGSVAEAGKPLKVALKADSGAWFTRCNQCQKSVNNEYPDTITLHTKGEEPTDKDTQFEMHKLKDGKFAFKADNGMWVAMCTDCIVDGAKKDFITVHVKAEKEDDIPSWAKFEVEELEDGKIALKADNGKFVARCNSCSPGASYPDQVTAHMDDSEHPSAQWELVDVE
jgi:hypothetical protein